MKNPKQVTGYSPASWWVILCAYLHCIGWGLSAIHQLNRTGYAVALVVGAVVVVLRWRSSPDIFPKIRLGKICRRFRRAFPLAYLILAGLAVAGGLLHGPTNHDALAYRIPRVLHWLSEERWHWIHTGFNQLNTRVCGIEWILTPLIAFTGSYRLVFLPNVVSFLLLPGLIFSLFRRLGINGRWAWHWMWLLPTGYCYVLQAGGAANDIFGAPFALAAIDFALRAKASGRFSDVALAVLSAALMSSVKSTNLPLLLPCAIALLPSARIALRRPIALAGTLMVATLCSFVPTAALNIKYTGDWTGRAAEMLPEAFCRGYPLTRFLFHLVAIPLHNLAPPIFPMAEKANRWINDLIPASVIAHLEKCFVAVSTRVRLYELQAEECAGVGFGITVLTIASVFAARRLKPVAKNLTNTGGVEDETRIMPLQRWIFVGVFMALFAFMTKAGWFNPARYLTPYYPLLLAVMLLNPAQVELVKKTWWRICAVAVFIVAGLLVVLSPHRPLWPAELALTKLGGQNPSNPLIVRALRVYSTYSRRSDAFAPVRKFLPADAKVLGFVTWDDPEASLWMPWGSRKIVHVCARDDTEKLRLKGIKYVLVKNGAFHWSHVQRGPNWPFAGTFAEWLAQQHGELVQTFSLDVRASGTPEMWHLVKLR